MKMLECRMAMSSKGSVLDMRTNVIGISNLVIYRLYNLFGLRNKYDLFESLTVTESAKRPV